MKKVRPKIVALALLILSFLAVGGVSIHKAVAPGGAGFGPEFEPDGG